MAMAERRNIEFGVEGGVTLRGWLFVPGAEGPAPTITMAHGYAGLKEHGMERFARAFAEAGFVVLVHDHRHFGASDGAERGDVDPGQQIADWRRAISFLESRQYLRDFDRLNEATANARQLYDVMLELYPDRVILREQRVLEPASSGSPAPPLLSMTPAKNEYSTRIRFASRFK